MKSDYFFDIHTHFIYGTDDGARDIKESLELLRMDYMQGARSIVATPHTGIYEPSSITDILIKLDEICFRIHDRYPDLKLYSGQEVLYYDSLTDDLDRGRILTLGKSRAVLIEFYPQESYTEILKAVRKIREGGYIPVLAHAERYMVLRKTGLNELRDCGGMIQLGSDAITNNPFNATSEWCKKQIIANNVSFLGSDMHRTQTRPPKFSGAADWVRTHIDADYAEDILYGNAQRLIGFSDLKTGGTGIIRDFSSLNSNKNDETEKDICVS